MSNNKDLLTTIDSAPKDGARVVVFCVTDDEGSAVVENEISVPGSGFRVLWAAMASYVPRQGEEGYWSDGIKRLPSPTHWMHPPL